MRLSTTVAVLISSAVLLVPGGASAADHLDPPVPLPNSPQGLKAPGTLPAELDPIAGYQPQTSCKPVAMPGMVKLRDLVLSTYNQGGKGNITTLCTDGVSEHSEGRAWDWSVDPDNAKQVSAAANFISWVTRNHGENARRLGIMYVIYKAKIWSVYSADSVGWHTSYDHVDHVHVSLTWNGARGNVSFWTGAVSPIDNGPCIRFAGTYAAITNVPNTKSCPRTADLVKKTNLAEKVYGSGKSATIASAQKKLGVPVTSVFDAATWTAVKRYQTAHDIPYTGVLDQPTWASLYANHVTTNVAYGYTKSAAVAYALAHYADGTIGEFRAGKPVLFLQTALRMPIPDRNGYFGAVTVAAVKAFQKSVGLPQSGVVTRADWEALGAS